MLATIICTSIFKFL